LERYGFSFAVNTAVDLGLGALGAWAGWVLLKRRSYAPMVACVAGGPIVVHSGHWIYGLALPTLSVISGALDPKYARLIIDMSLPLVLNVTLAAVWLLILMTVLRAKGRLEFEPGSSHSTTPALWISLVISSGIQLLILVLQQLMWASTPPNK
jgi:hypothetical protein